MEPQLTPEPGRRLESAVLLILTAAIFAVDAFTPLDVAIAVAYVLVLLPASRIWPPAGVRALGLGCIGLTLGAYLLSYGPHVVPSPAGRMLVAVAAIGIATRLVLQCQGAIAELRLGQEALRRSQAYLAGAQRLTRTGSFGLRVPSGEMVWSQEAARILGYPPSTPAGIDRVLERTVPDDRRSVREAYARALARDGDFDFEYRIQLPDGGIRHLHVLAELSHDERGGCEYLGAVTDVTERIEAERQLHASHVQLAHASRVSMLGELAASVAHEVNQPLTAATSNAQAARRWLRRAEPNLEEAGLALDGIERACERATGVVRRIRALARRAEPEHQSLDLHALVADTVDLLARDFERAGVELRLELHADPAEVVGDRIELQQVLLNLLMNAVQAMAGGAGLPRLTVASRNEDGAVLLQVQDNGPGIAPEAAAQVFDPFYSTKPDGMGMGLAICRSIMTMHGGSIALRESAAGCCFELRLPAMAAAPAAATLASLEA
ncbi:hypothetical protein B0920_05325 [Massilia sp. KIM]|uniref:sensor histidine kinase n=1 Tax=Massilia sp. KIM TaxID=1955422 RepID=UPI00098FD600|nr:ATP-binding protein [Massilia sp. KIM]OON62856.1 hypothetical protein B0920_05325 [Massilia sp. KIM]